jgi:hypothetical protein
LIVAGLLPLPVLAQGGPPPSSSMAPPAWSKDLPGYWESLITQDWRLRMVTPSKDDFIGIPLNAAAKRVADGWDPAKDEAAGQQCRSYGAGMIMVRPERVHINWQDDNTLRMDVDAGTQTRLFHFAGMVPTDFQPSWQGYSKAAWVPRRSPGYGPLRPNGRYLEITTTHMLPGYMRQNGVPYSATAVVTEDYDLAKIADQEMYLAVTNTVTDPVYLDYPYTVTAIFKKQADNTGWNPTSCSASW